MSDFAQALSQCGGAKLTFVAIDPTRPDDYRTIAENVGAIHQQGYQHLLLHGPDAVNSFVANGMVPKTDLDQSVFLHNHFDKFGYNAAEEYSAIWQQAESLGLTPATVGPHMVTRRTDAATLLGVLDGTIDASKMPTLLAAPGEDDHGPIAQEERPRGAFQRLMHRVLYEMPAPKQEKPVSAIASSVRREVDQFHINRYLESNQVMIAAASEAAPKLDKLEGRALIVMPYDYLWRDNDFDNQVTSSVCRIDMSKQTADPALASRVAGEPRLAARLDWQPDAVVGQPDTRPMLAAAPYRP